MANILDGRVALITGGASGQGAEEARLFAAEGAKVVITDLNEDGGSALADALGEGAIFLRHDVASASDWEMIVKAATERFDKIDILVNNAGISGSGSVLDVSEEEMRRFMDINMLGALLGIQAVVPAMPDGGSIINISSSVALRGFPSLAAYGVSKWALRGLSRYAAQDLAPRKIRVNTILPGVIDTPMMRNSGGDMAKEVLKIIPLARFGEEREIAETALFLASDASAFMTGSELLADGGVNA